MKKIIATNILILAAFIIYSQSAFGAFSATASFSTGNGSNASYTNSSNGYTSNGDTGYNANTGSMSKITDINSLSSRIGSIGNTAIYIMVGLAVIYIIWTAVHYLTSPAASEERRKGLTDIFWGIVGLAIIVSIWGLVNILVNTFDTNSDVQKNRFPNANFVSGN